MRFIVLVPSGHSCLAVQLHPRHSQFVSFLSSTGEPAVERERCRDFAFSTCIYDYYYYCCCCYQWKVTMIMFVLLHQHNFSYWWDWATVFLMSSANPSHWYTRDWSHMGICWLGPQPGSFDCHTGDGFSHINYASASKQRCQSHGMLANCRVSWWRKSSAEPDKILVSQCCAHLRAFSAGRWAGTVPL